MENIDRNEYKELSILLANEAKTFMEEYSDTNKDAVYDSFTYVTEELKKHKGQIKEVDYDYVDTILRNPRIPWSDALTETSIHLNNVFGLLTLLNRV